MNRVLINYCYSCDRTVIRTNVLSAEATADQRERADRRASERLRATARPTIEGDSQRECR